MIAEFGVLPWDTERERGGAGEEERAEKTKEKGELMWRNQALLEEVVRQAGKAASVAAASTVTAGVSMLTLAKFCSPAEDFVGAVVPAAARHAGRGVINFKL